VNAPFWVAVALLGGAGAVARFLFDRAISRRSDSLLPFGTTVVNLSGAFLLGVVSEAGGGKDLQLLAGGALLGAYTTFSTWLLESQRLLEEGADRLAVANLVLPLLLGLAVFRLGELVGGVL